MGITIHASVLAVNSCLLQHKHSQGYPKTYSRPWPTVPIWALSSPSGSVWCSLQVCSSCTLVHGHTPGFCVPLKTSTYPLPMWHLCPDLWPRAYLLVQFLICWGIHTYTWVGEETASTRLRPLCTALLAGTITPELSAPQIFKIPASPSAKFHFDAVSPERAPALAVTDRVALLSFCHRLES